eukprot:TRINITY_DN19825_c0_g1_i3.p1 TRINITY_DN19825_c0_g1~~TRINITY_DN19825_c0_g1_i3.p1  ORF type:complete len:268 (+),score=71.28 TRINITY_DN19825_c0_g1_i3:60-863(+)
MASRLCVPPLCLSTPCSVTSCRKVGVMHPFLKPAREVVRAATEEEQHETINEAERRKAAARCDLGFTFLRQTEDAEDAAEEFYGALSLAPRHADALAGLGAAYLQLEHMPGSLEAAMEVLRAALAVSPKHGLAHLQLGLALERSGDSKAAAAQFEAVLENVPGSEAARTAREKLSSDTPSTRPPSPLAARGPLGPVEDSASDSDDSDVASDCGAASDIDSDADSDHDSVVPPTASPPRLGSTLLQDPAEAAARNKEKYADLLQFISG